MGSYIPAYLRSKNRDVVLHLLMQQKALSRANIAKQAKMSFPTVGKVIDDFLNIGLVSEAETASTSPSGLGRKSQLLRLNEDAYSTVGIFFEGNRLHVGLVNLCSRVMDQIDYPLQEDPSTPEEYEQISTIMTGAVRSLQETHPATRILGVGVGLPGVVDAKAMTFRRWGKLHRFYEFYKTFSTLSDIPTFIENDMNAASFGEMLLRDDSEYANLLYLSIGTGLGAGIIINNRIWHGDANYAGDIGIALSHLDLSTIPTDLTPLRLNNQINAAAIKKQFRVDIQQGDDCAPETRQEICEYIVKCFLPIIYNLNYILDISKYVLAGTITDYLSPDIFDCINRYLSALHKVDIIPHQLSVVPSVSNQAGIIGTASIALENCLSTLLA